MQQKFAVVSKIAALSLFACFAAPVMAQSAGSVVVSAGWAHITPNDSSTPLTVTAPAFAAGAKVGSGAGVSRTETLGVAVNYFYTDNLVFAADLGVPPTYKLHGEGTLAGVGEIGTAKQWAPTGLVKYYFGDAKAKLRPFVGGGVTYVRYSDVELTSKFQSSIGGVTSAELSSSFAPVITAGLSYEVATNWYANVSLSYVKLKTDANLTTSVAAIPGKRPAFTAQSNTTLTLDPLVAFLAIGYRF
ncbi:OmpW family outer membrane protein [Undibacterium sp.]|uniref:OmpW/AlkL family protein n=1 Tax=Undibacterium sp. TaxID=1914977 RepID=UPI0025D5011C|nr:OmpW family outer membrane protein [Undibacterium sp.]